MEDTSLHVSEHHADPLPNYSSSQNGAQTKGSTGCNGRADGLTDVFGRIPLRSLWQLHRGTPRVLVPPSS